MLRIFDLAELFQPPDLPGPYLLLRPYGERAYPFLAQQLLDLPSGESLVLDFRHVEVMDSSFADETIVKIVEEMLDGKYPDRFIVLQSVNEDSALNIDDRLARRKLRTGIIAVNGESWRILGHIERNLNEALKVLMAEKEITARDLADRFDLEINTASMRLKKLYEGRLAKRREEVSTSGRFHVYESLT